MAQRDRYLEVKRGRLSKDELAEIDRLGAKGWSPGRIANRLERHPGTVNYAMHRLGHRKLVRRTTSYVRNGVLVVPFSEAEDQMLEKLRGEGLTTTRIAHILGDSFGHPRSAHTVNMRLVMLASGAEYEAAA